jgi:hypothetical protein
MIFNRKKSKIDQQLRELEKEASRLRSDIRNLSRAINNPETGQMPEIRTEPFVTPKKPAAPPDPIDPDPESGVPVKEEPSASSEEEKPRPPASLDLFSWSTARPSRRKKEPSARPARPGPGPGREVLSDVYMKRGALDQRFANYLSSSGFSTSRRRSRRERSTLRNKAIFMVIVVLLMLYVVIRLLSR